MRLALAIERFDHRLGGQAVWTRGFAAHLIRAGHEVHVVSSAFGPHGLPIVPHAVAPTMWPLARARRFGRAIAAVGADAVHDAGTTWAAGVLQPHTGSELCSLDRLIATEPPLRRARAALSPKMIRLRAQMRRLERKQAAAASSIVAVSVLARDVLAARQPGAREKVALIRNGVDTALFDPAVIAALRAPMRARLILADEPLFVIAAHNARLKGVDTALRAVGLLRTAGLEVRLAVAAAVPSPALRGLAAALGIEAQVSYLGHVDDMRALYAAADVLVHPTRWDACSLVVLEALACGLPVVTTCSNGAAEIIEHGESGFVMDRHGDADALASHMRLLLAPERRAAMGARARRTALRHDLARNYAGVERLVTARAAVAAGCADG